MKKSISLILATLMIISGIFVGCSSAKNNETKTTTENGLEANADEYIMDEVTVTDKNGKTVTDKNGKAVTEEVIYKQVTDKNGKKVVAELDDKGNVKKDKNGNPITVKITTQKATTTKKKKTTKPEKKTTIKPNGDEKTTKKEVTTVPAKDDNTPKPDDNGDKVNFSSEDQQIIKSMLEVPYLYKANYDSSSGSVPTEIAAHTAIWMAEREGLNTKTFASGTIVLDLFKFYGQTVVNFKAKCNKEKGGAAITYNSNNDTFSVSSFEDKKQSVTLTSIQDLGNNNYYRVNANVSGAGSITKVSAVIQRNKLDSTLGFSIKGLHWS